MAPANARKLDAAANAQAINIGWTIFAGTIVFFMHAGFTFLETGTVRAKNTQSILVKNLLNLLIATAMWFICGYGLAFGEDNNSKVHGGGFYGTTMMWTNDKNLSTDDVLPSEANGSHVHWFFQWTFAATTATIVSGAVAERVKLPGFCIISAVLSGIVYPCVVHWGWSSGLLAVEGYNDFAGSGVVHMTGGIAALCAAAVLGPRYGRFTSGQEPQPQSVFNITIGTMILWFGWYGFNCGSTTALAAGSDLTAARCAINTTMGASLGGIVAFAISSARKGYYDTIALCNGVLGGLVSVTAGCASLDPQVAGLSGAIGGVVLVFSTVALEKLKIDDCVGAFPVHGACGAWGVLACALFDITKGAAATNKNFEDSGMKAAFLGILYITLWTAGTITPLALILKGAGLLRVSEEVEDAGLDAHEFSSPDAVKDEDE